MAVGVMDIEEGGASLPGKTTFQVVMCSIIAAVGGLMFGYDIGISGLFLRFNYFFSFSFLGD